MASSLNITTRAGRLDMHRTSPRVHLESTHPQLSVDRRAPQVSIDGSEYREAVGLRTPGAVAANNAAKGKSDVVQGISRVAAEGDALMRIEEGTSFADIAQSRSEPQEAQLTLAPVPPPRITVDPGGVNISARLGDVRIDAEVAPIQFNYQPGKVTVDTEVPSRMNVQA